MGRPTELPQSVFEQAAVWEHDRRPFVLAVVTDTGGSTPRISGALMAVTADAQVGTVGGGAFELRVIDEARALLAAPERSTALVDVHLVRDLGMCCGGRMTAFLDKVNRAPRLWLFGAGHIAAELAPLAQRAGFDVTVVDGRAEWADPTRFPAGVEVLDAEPEDLLKRRPPAPEDYVVVVTHSHPLDELLVGALCQGTLPQYVGLVGSRGKWAKFRAQLGERGVSAACLDAVHCPVGLSIGAVTPGEIAVSIVAEMVAVRRGAQVPEPPSAAL